MLPTNMCMLRQQIITLKLGTVTSVYLFDYAVRAKHSFSVQPKFTVEPTLKVYLSLAWLIKEKHTALVNVPYNYICYKTVK